MCSRRRWCPGSTTCGLRRSVWPPASPTSCTSSTSKPRLVEAAQALVDAVASRPARTRPRASAPTTAPRSGAAPRRRSRSDRGPRAGRLCAASRSSSSPATFSSAICRSCAALPVAQLRMEIARLGIDQVGRERAGIAPEERVGERAVAPEEAREVDAHEQLGERVEQAVAQVGTPGPLKSRRYGSEKSRCRVISTASAPGGPRPGARDDADGLDHRHDLVGQLAQQPVLVPRDARRQRLERVEHVAVADEAHDVAVDAARHLDDALALPLGERLAPRAGRGSRGSPGARASGSAAPRSR